MIAWNLQEKKKIYIKKIQNGRKSNLDLINMMSDEFGPAQRIKEKWKYFHQCFVVKLLLQKYVQYFPVGRAGWAHITKCVVSWDCLCAKLSKKYMKWIKCFWAATDSHVKKKKKHIYFLFIHLSLMLVKCKHISMHKTIIYPNTALETKVMYCIGWPFSIFFICSF